MQVRQFSRDIMAIAGDRLRSQLRVKVWVVMEIIEPIMWLTMYSQLYTDRVTRSFLGSRTYLDFFVPGLLIMSCFFAAAWCGLALLDRLRSGFINRLLVTPVSRWAVIIGYAFALIVTLWVQVLIVVLTALVLGWRPEPSLALFASVFAVTTLVGLAFSSLSFALTFVGQNEDSIIPVINFVQLPMLFLSGIFLPISLSPQWVQWAAQFNPLAWAHHIVITDVVAPLSPAVNWLLLFALFALFSVWLARRAIRPYM